MSGFVLKIAAFTFGFAVWQTIVCMNALPFLHGALPIEAVIVLLPVVFWLGGLSFYFTYNHALSVLSECRRLAGQRLKQLAAQEVCLSVLKPAPAPARKRPERF